MSDRINLLYISYWSLNEPLTASTILPYMAILEEDPNIASITFVTVEHSDEGIRPSMDHLTKLEHLPIHFTSETVTPLTKARLFMKLPHRLAAEVRRRHINVIDAKASVAGILAYKVSRLTGVPFMVESFEPHSLYMLECKVWRSWSPFYLYNRYYERKQIQHAKYLITVTQNYKRDLEQEGIEEDRVIVIPSITEMFKFKIDPEARAECRRKEGIPDSRVVGIYVGKFGGLYLNDEAYEIIGEARKHFNNDFHVVILTPQDAEEITTKLHEVGFDDSQVTVKLVSHNEVPMYLAASDFAFSLIRYTPIKAYQSPVKNGEYWASGLPMLLTDKVSDDHWIIRKHGIGGALFDLDKDNVKEALAQLSAEMSVPGHKEKIRELAHEYRSIEIARRVYKRIFDPKLYD